MAIKLKNIIRKSNLLLLGILLQVNTVMAQNGYNYAFPLNPRIIGDLTTSRIIKADSDILLPLYGNNAQILYVDTQGNYGSDHSWMGSIGGGIRAVFNNQLWGAYVFGDRDSDGGRFCVVNPGLEVMHNAWDAHINGYFPTREKKRRTDFNFGSQFGINDFVRFNKHSQFDFLFAEYQIVGNGLDGELGYSMPMQGNRGRIFLGGYFYSPAIVSKLSGVEGGLEVPLNRHTALRMSASHDNVMGTQGSLGLRFEFGGIIQRSDRGLEQRILDPVIRHEGTLGTASGIISQKKLLNSGQEGLVNDNIWFFRPGTAIDPTNVTEADCTYEHPCIGINSSIINSINSIKQGAFLYLAPGKYTNSALGAGYTLNTGQSIFGRTQNYIQPAQGDQRALVDDTLFLNGNNIVNNVQVNGQSDTENVLVRAGIVINKMASGLIQINNSNITTTTTDANHDAIGVLNLLSHANVDLNQSTITVNSPDLAEGIFNENPNHFEIRNTTIMSSSSNRAVGIFNKGFGHIIISNSNINSESPNIALGIFNQDYGTMDLLNSNLTENSPNLAEGIFNEDDAIIRVLKSQINTNSAALAVGVFNEDNGSVNISNSIITANSSTLAEGIFNEDNGNINILNARIFANSTNSAVGIFNEDFGHINISNTAIFANSINEAAGIFNEDFGHINISNTTIFANSTNSAVGIFNEDYGHINIANSIIIAYSPIHAVGIVNEDFGYIVISNSIIIPNSPTF